MEKENNQLKSIASEKKITRKDAIKKAGLATLTATTLVFLDTKAHACASGDPTKSGTVPTTGTSVRRRRKKRRRRP